VAEMQAVLPHRDARPLRERTRPIQDGITRPPPALCHVLRDKQLDRPPPGPWPPLSRIT
jgi:hypothetical protein